MEQDAVEEMIVVRGYQLQVLGKAKVTNTIAFIPTGSGKTLISLLLAKHIGGKSVFFAPTRALAERHSRAAARQLGIRLMSFKGHRYSRWTQRDWERVLDDNDMLAFTPMLLYSILSRDYLRLEQFQMIIVDECHHCIGNSLYQSIMEYYSLCPTKPRVLAMTASPLNKMTKPKLDRIKSRLEELCGSLDSEFYNIDRDEVTNEVNAHEILTAEFEEEPSSLNLESLMSSLMGIAGTDERLLNSIDELQENGEEICILLGNSAFGQYLVDFAANINHSEFEDAIRRFLGRLKLANSNRYKQLVKVLGLNITENPYSKAIVIVERRIVSHYLHEMLTNEQELEEVLRFGKMIGQTRSAKVVRAWMTEAEQQDTLDKLRTDALNCIVSTSICEEGLDISACNMVLRYDPIPTNLRSFVQSKARARHPDSKFVCLVPAQEFDENTDELHTLEQAHVMMTDVADTFTIKPDLFVLEPTACYVVPSTGARCEGARAVSQLHELVQAILRTATNKIKYNFKEKPDPTRCSPIFQCSIVFPDDLSRFGCTSRGYFSKKEEAKRDACLVAIESFHLGGLLDDSLRPSSSKSGRGVARQEH
jgi:endoribonuclease Dicer